MQVEKQSPCKVNLILNILGKRPDGFHELETVMQHPWAAQTLDALLRSASIRDASRIAGVHHSTMQARLETIRGLLSFDPMDGIGRTRVGLAFLAWRVRHSTALDLPPPTGR